jgi:hypothetical protein
MMAITSGGGEIIELDDRTWEHFDVTEAEYNAFNNVFINTSGLPFEFYDMEENEWNETEIKSYLIRIGTGFTEAENIVQL